MAKIYPHKQPAEILTDLVALTPGQEGKWFAAAKDAGLYDEAIALANRALCAPQTLQAAERAGQREQALERLRALVAHSSGEPFMIKALARLLERCR